MKVLGKNGNNLVDSWYLNVSPPLERSGRTRTPSAGNPNPTISSPIGVCVPATGERQQGGKASVSKGWQGERLP